MSQPINLKEADRKVFRAAFDDGLWDVFLASFLSVFAIAPYLSASLGDFWSSAIFLPVLTLVYLGIWLVRKTVVIPRVGVVKFGPSRKTRLLRFTIVMLVVNVLAFILGILAAVSFGRIPGLVISIIFGLIMLSGLSLAAYFLEIPRLYFYGLLVGISPPIGEWLFQRGLATHHGFPITFGTTAVLMTLVGLYTFFHLLRSVPAPVEKMPSGEVNNG